MGGATPLFGSQIQVQLVGRIVPARVEGVATNQHVDGAATDLVRAVEDRDLKPANPLIRRIVQTRALLELPAPWLNTISRWASGPHLLRENNAIYLLKLPFRSVLSVVYATDRTSDAMRQSRFRI